MPTDNQEQTPIQNISTADQIKYINRPVADRRTELLPQATTNNESISQGIGEYQAYQEAVKVSASDPKNLEVQRAIEGYIFEKSQFQSFNNVSTPSDIAHKSEAEINTAFDQVKAQEASYVDAVSLAYGNFVAAVDAGDVSVATLILTSHPDLAHQPENCQLLEQIIAKNLIQNPDVNVVTIDKRIGQVKVEKKPFITELTKKTAQTTPDSDDIRKVRNITSTSMDPLPEQSQESLARILKLAEITQAYDKQQTDNKAPSTRYDDSYQKIVDGLEYRIPENSDKKRFSAPIRESKNALVNERQKYYSQQERTAALLSNFMSTETYSQLPPPAQQYLQSQLLGHCLALAEYTAGHTSEELHVGYLAEFLSPIITPENTANLENIDPATGLASLDKIVLSKIADNLGKKSFSAKETFLKKIGSVALEKQEAAIKKATEAQAAAQAAEAAQIAQAAAQAEKDRQNAITEQQKPLAEALFKNPDITAILGDFIKKPISSLSKEITTTSASLDLLVQNNPSLKDIVEFAKDVIKKSIEYATDTSLFTESTEEEIVRSGFLGSKKEMRSKIVHSINQERYNQLLMENSDNPLNTKALEALFYSEPYLI